MIYAKGQLVAHEDGSKIPPTSTLGAAGIFAVGFILTDTEQFFYSELDFSSVDTSSHDIIEISQEEALQLYQVNRPEAILLENGSFGRPAQETDYVQRTLLDPADIP